MHFKFHLIGNMMIGIAVPHVKANPYAIICYWPLRLANRISLYWRITWHRALDHFSLAHTPTLPVFSCWSRYLAYSALVAPSKSWLKSHYPFLHTSASRLYGGQDGIVGWEAAAMAQRRKGSYITIITTRFVLELHISCNSAQILHWPGFAYSFKVMKLNVDTLRAIFWEVWCFWLFFLPDLRAFSD